MANYRRTTLAAPHRFTSTSCRNLKHYHGKAKSCSSRFWRSTTQSHYAGNISTANDACNACVYDKKHRKCDNKGRNIPW